MATKSKRSVSISKHNSKGSITSVRRNHSTLSSRDRRSSAQSADEDFTTSFQKYCVRFKAWTVPDVVVASQEPPKGVFPELLFEYFQANLKMKRSKEISKIHQPLLPQVMVITFDGLDISIIHNIVILKHYLVDRAMLIALRKTLQKFNTIKILKLEFCCLKNTDLRTLKTVLQKNESIIDLSINGNPNKFQNFYILLKNTKLTYVSMRFCQINDRGAELIALQLKDFSEQPLLSLNLSSNFISDEGIKSLANSLRSNRKLISLDVADNWLTDLGCITLCEIVKRFPLTHEEIVIRRHRIMNYLLTKAELIEEQKNKFLQSSDKQSLSDRSRRSSRDGGSRGGKDSLSRKSSHYSTASLNKKDSASNISKKITDIDMQIIEDLVETEMGIDEHPFVKDSFPDNNEIYCKGNFSLVHLNLSYNKITINGLKYLINVVQYQNMVVVYSQEGLSHIKLEGNSFPEFCMELENINYLLKESFAQRLTNLSHESRRNSKRKRSSLGRISA